MNRPNNWIKVTVDVSKGGLNYHYADGTVIHLSKDELHQEVFGPEEPATAEQAS